jgi:hypothetical protein
MKKLVHGFSVDTQMNLNPQQQNESKAAATKQSPRNNLTITKKKSLLQSLHQWKNNISKHTIRMGVFPDIENSNEDNDHMCHHHRPPKRSTVVRWKFIRNNFIFFIL